MVKNAGSGDDADSSPDYSFRYYRNYMPTSFGDLSQKAVDSMNLAVQYLHPNLSRQHDDKHDSVATTPSTSIAVKDAQWSIKKRIPMSYKWISVFGHPPYVTSRQDHMGRDNPSVVNLRSMLSIMSAISDDSDQSRLPDGKYDAASVENHDADENSSYSGTSTSKKPVLDAETASRLAEGTIIALRDMTLDEAVELNTALQFWTERWERPLLSWLEAGPLVWLSKEGYNHQKIGQRVSQIQAALARRCLSVGELQQHIWRAGWQKGVAQWGVLGQGAQWAAVVGGDGGMDEDSGYVGRDNSSSLEVVKKGPSKSLVGSSRKGSKMDVVVDNRKGGRIISNDPALAAWSVDAIRIVRDQLYKAGDEHSPLPHFENWSSEKTEFRKHSSDDSNGNFLPRWARRVKDLSKRTMKDFHDEGFDFENIAISNLSLMAVEVQGLLESMASQLQRQRDRRLEKLRPALRVRRHWYVIAAGAPFIGYASYCLVKDSWGITASKQIISNITDFWKEHVAEPLSYVYAQLFTNRIRRDVTDHVARMNAIESLKKMILTWLDEKFPKMDEKERRQRAEIMDMSLIEKKKEDSVKNALFEISDIVRMSLIEMQFIKKELMNAMSAMDELMQSNEFNFKLAAMTPAILIMFGASKLFRFLRYALFKVGKSREETHEEVRLIVLDIERLLVMRDCPPSPPRPHVCDRFIPRRDVTDSPTRSERNTNVVDEISEENNVLLSDDLGMLMLLIHECRTIMWKNARRFSRQDRRSMEEDLAELSGERGAVSVKQQLLIVSRMFRTYPHLKVVSSGGVVDTKRYV